MSNLALYDEKWTLEPFGLVNSGSTCYFNAALQTLFSLPAFNQIIRELRGHFEQKNNYVACELARIFAEMKQTPNAPNSSLASIRVFNSLNKVLPKSNSRQGQESAIWAIEDILLAINHVDIYHLFYIKYNCTIHCNDCNERTSINLDETTHIQMPENYQNMNEYIYSHTDKVEYKCEKCGIKKIRERLYKLGILREILCIAFPVAAQNKSYPPALTFPYKKGGKLEYKLCAVIEHSGGYSPATHQSSGHYWAKILRQGNWHTANDSSISAANSTPTANAHLLFYHVAQILPK